MNKKPIVPFTYLQVSKWREVDLRSTVLAANASCRGADFSGCSKADILSSFSKGQYWSCSMRQDVFVKHMDRLVKLCKKHKELFSRARAELLAEIKKEDAE